MNCNNIYSGAKEDGTKTTEGGVDAEMPETKENGTAADEHDNSADAPAEGEVVNEQELKYWKAVKENPADFTSWTYLLQFVEQEVSYNNCIFALYLTCKFCILNDTL